MVVAGRNRGPGSACASGSPCWPAPVTLPGLGTEIRFPQQSLVWARPQCQSERTGVGSSQQTPWGRCACRVVAPESELARRISCAKSTRGPDPTAPRHAGGGQLLGPNALQSRQDRRNPDLAGWHAMAAHVATLGTPRAHPGLPQCLWIIPTRPQNAKTAKSSRGSGPRGTPYSYYPRAGTR